MDVTGCAKAERAVAVIQGDLRNGPEEILASRLEGHRCGDYHGRDARTNDIGGPALGGDKAEHTIGRRDQPPGKADPFRLVTVEQGVGRMTGQNRRQLPGQIQLNSL
jgi:hypothetical protein